MPANVLRQVKTDFCLPVDKISPLLGKLASKGRPIKIRKPSAKECANLFESSISEFEPSAFTCPECGGAVIKIQNGKNIQFRCHVGHAFSLDSFSEGHADALERALWVALRKLNEQRSLQESLANSDTGSGLLKKRHQENAEAAERDIRLLHEILGRL
jgi:two-component system chemotaxis response regulator CheB